jgi:hypothetical protein
MKIRLLVIVPPASAFEVEHHEATLRVGRDPGCHLPLGGEGTSAVSSSHACIELTTEGAFLHDLGSSNGTFLNGKRVKEPVRLIVGDEVGLGRTGPRLQVLELNMAGAPMPAGGAAVPTWLAALKKHQDRVLIGAAAVVGVCLVAFVLVLLLGRGSRGPEPNGRASVAPQPTQPVPDERRPPDTLASGVKPEVGKPGNDTKPPARPEVDPPTKPVAARQVVGRVLDVNRPAVLLQRQADRGPWQRLKPGSQVSTGDLLVSLPGYRSEVQTDSGVRLTLWGNLPEQVPAPLLDSAVILEPAPAGAALALALDRGRILLTNRKESRPARVQLRFHDQTWEVTLHDGQSEVGLELLGLPPGGAAFRTGESPRAALYLFVLKGAAGLKVGFRDYPDVQSPSMLVWDNQSDAASRGPVRVGEAEVGVWSTTPAPTPQLEQMTKALEDLAGRPLDQGAERALAVQVDDPKEAAQRILAGYALGALDAVPELVDVLDKSRYGDARQTAIVTLRHWMGRRGGNSKALYDQMVQKGYLPQEAEVVLQLLQPFSQEQASQPETYAALIEYLRSKRQAVRALAYTHLVFLAPDGVRSIPYDPAGSADERERAYQQWKKLVPDGKVPPRPAKPQG